MQSNDTAGYQPFTLRWFLCGALADEQAVVKSISGWIILERGRL